MTEDVNLMDPNLQVPYADSWTVGLQRAIGRNMAVEVRYVGTRARDLWETLNYNEINIFDNGFIQEFRAAQDNLRANVAAGLAAQGFAYRGPGTGTVPLPIMFAYFQGAGDPTNSAAYTSTNFRTNNDYLTPLATFNPNPFTFANNLFSNATQRNNAAASGRIPANFFVSNPDLLGGRGPDHQHRQVRLPRAATRAPPPAGAGSAVQRQLRLRQPEGPFVADAPARRSS